MNNKFLPQEVVLKTIRNMKGFGKCEFSYIMSGWMDRLSFPSGHHTRWRRVWSRELTEAHPASSQNRPDQSKEQQDRVSEESVCALKDECLLTSGGLTPWTASTRFPWCLVSRWSEPIEDQKLGGERGWGIYLPNNFPDGLSLAVAVFLHPRPQLLAGSPLLCVACYSFHHCTLPGTLQTQVWWQFSADTNPGVFRHPVQCAWTLPIHL